jgi:hypothetical protein
MSQHMVFICKVAEEIQAQLALLLPSPLAFLSSYSLVTRLDCLSPVVCHKGIIFDNSLRSFV